MFLVFSHLTSFPQMFYETDSDQDDSCQYGYDVEEMDPFETAMFDPFGDVLNENTTNRSWEDL